ncbi:MAG: SH3 domain-containing protein, partial [Gammaproteobacteria bacterium]
PGRPIEVWHPQQPGALARPLDTYANCFVKRHRPSGTATADTPGAATTPFRPYRLRKFFPWLALSQETLVALYRLRKFFFSTWILVCLAAAGFISWVVWLELKKPAQVSENPNIAVTGGIQYRPSTAVDVSENAYVNTKRLNLRSGPGAEYSVTTQLGQGAPVVLLKRAQSSDGGTWVRVRAGSYEGWVAEKLLSKSSPVQGSEKNTQQSTFESLNRSREAGVQQRKAAQAEAERRASQEAEAQRRTVAAEAQRKAQQAAAVQKRFEAARVEAERRYEQAQVTARSRYQQAQVTAQGDFRKLTYAQNSYRRALASTQSSYERALASAANSYERARALAQNSYERALVSARNSYQTTESGSTPRFFPRPP